MPGSQCAPSTSSEQRRTANSESICPGIPPRSRKRDEYTAPGSAALWPGIFPCQSPDQEAGERPRFAALDIARRHLGVAQDVSAWRRTAIVRRGGLRREVLDGHTASSAVRSQRGPALGMTQPVNVKSRRVVEAIPVWHAGLVELPPSGRRERARCMQAGPETDVSRTRGPEDCGQTSGRPTVVDEVSITIEHAVEIDEDVLDVRQSPIRRPTECAKMRTATSNETQGAGLSDSASAPVRRFTGCSSTALDLRNFESHPTPRT